jgi:prepilin-type N-terminal cleavage/methylation domain-containing protein
MRTRRMNNGFTLLEITVTLAIIAIIFSIVANGFNRTNSESNLRATADTLASDIRAAALNALNSEQFQLQSPNGWGVRFDIGSNSTYTIFADLNNNRVYDTNEKFKTVEIGRNITIAGICFTLCASVNGSLDFTIADGVVYYDNTAVTNITGPVTVNLQDNVIGATEDVEINSLGGVSVQ